MKNSCILSMRPTALLVGAVLLLQLAAAAQTSGKPADLQTLMWNQEHELAKAETQQDRKLFQKVLDNKLIYVAFDGLVFTKQKIVQDLNYIDVSHYHIENLKTRALGPDAALVTYDLNINGNVAGHDLPAKQYASSVWLKKGTTWQLIFHQSTPAHH